MNVLFTRPNQPREVNGSQPQDFFFANDIGNVTTTINGLHLNGSCAPVDMDSTNLATLSSKDSLAQFCNSSIPHFQGNNFSTAEAAVKSYSVEYVNPSFSLSLNSCNNVTDSDSHPSHSRNVGYFHYDYTVGEGQPSRGLIQCRSTLSTGVANVSGLSHTYADFQEQELYKTTGSDGSKVEIDVTVMDPVGSVFWGLSQSGNGSRGLGIQDGLILGGLGFTYIGVGADREWASPSPNDISRDLWSAMMHSVGAVGVMSRDETPPFPALMPVPIAVYTRDLSYAFGAWFLLAFWLALIAVITAWGYRRTFSHNLDSYVAAELISREGCLLPKNVPIGGAEDNSRLKEPFKALNLGKEYDEQAGLESEKLKRSETGCSY
ncbi:hypothetical protein V5O48_011705 [Marasmius crinis-equi]|uniref:Uncharacterized protein n=1 Tax=Marasmius crinis-equi TaxID=585013 RepID=A0ABR3F4V0_9AGAR